MCVYIYPHVCNPTTYTCKFINIHVCLCIYTRMYMGSKHHMLECLYIFIYIYIYTHTQASYRDRVSYMHKSTTMYIYIHIYTHTNNMHKHLTVTGSPARRTGPCEAANSSSMYNRESLFSASALNHVHVCVCVFLCVNPYAYMCVRTNTYIHIHTYTYIHILCASAVHYFIMCVCACVYGCTYIKAWSDYISSVCIP